MDIMTDKKMPKNAEKWTCLFCDFECSKQSNFVIHELTRKHKNREKRYKMISNDAKKMPKNAENIFTCKCGKNYKYSSGLWRHSKTCNYIVKNYDENEKDFLATEEIKILTTLITDLVKSNSELQHSVLEVCKYGTNNNNTLINNNSHNKTFNLNVFLNEECKDAMNLTDFVDSLQFQLSDLEKVGELGYVNGLSNIIIRNLKALDINKRPVHCSDTKRETIFIKEADKWEKENEEKEKLIKAIKTIANKNIRMIPKWREKYPDCAHSDSCKSDEYNKIIIQALDTNITSNQKIIRNIAKEVKIDK